jgi:hypothetical protein
VPPTLRGNMASPKMTFRTGLAIGMGNMVSWALYRRAAMLFVLAILGSSPGLALAEGKPVRLALVVGVTDYPDTDRLQNASNDAKAMATVLPGAGFEVVRDNALLDPTKGQLYDAVSTLFDKAKAASAAGDDVTVLFYFAGHGVQFKGTNYLVPTGSMLFGRSPTESEYMDQTLSAQFVLDRLADSGARRVILILDACRTNPFNPRERAARLEGGLTAMGPPMTGDGSADSMIFYASEPRRPALDDAGGRSNSPFTAALTEYLSYDGMTAGEMFSYVRDRVIVDTDRRQKPYFEGALTDFRFGREPSSIDRSPLPAPPSPNAPARPSINVNRPGPEVLAGVLKVKPIAEILALAEKGDGFSQWLLGIAYLTAEGVPKDVAVGRQWARKAVANGVGRAAGTLGWSYLYAGAGSDVGEARGWYEVGIALDDASSMNNMGLLYGEGRGVARDPVAAARLFRRAAALGYSPSMQYLGRSLLENRADAKFQREFGSDLAAQGLAYLHQAYDAGWKLAAEDLAWAYSANGGVTPDPAKAAFYRGQ